MDIKFHVYAICYNEERVLPFFFNNYSQADKIFLLDNYSDDDTRNIVNEYISRGMDIEVVKFDTDNEFDDTTNRNLKNTVWTNSVGLCDYVIVQDLDEFLMFSDFPFDLKRGLLELHQNNVSYKICDGYEMCCTDEEYNNIPLCEKISNYVHKGFKSPSYCKPCLFNPNVILETNFEFGQHTWKPVFRDNHINNESDLHLILLHYKHLGKKWELDRRLLMGNRMSKLNITFGCSLEYIKNRQDTIDHIENIHKQSNDITNIMFPHDKVRRITCKLSGDLGNDLSMVATTLLLSKKHKMFSFFSDNKYKDTILRKLPYKDTIDTSNYISVKDNNIPSEGNLLVSFTNIEGIDKYANYIRSMILVDDFYVLQQINMLRQQYSHRFLVGVYIAKNTSLEYYKKSIMEMETIHKDVTYLLFSRDQEWCKEEFPDFYICDIKEDYIQLLMLSKLDGHIVSDSLSWWGAFLSGSSKVILPNTLYKYKKEWIIKDS